ncbi:hypothetical protein CLV24_1274 [Pontibacter ummariensis]|uniref:Uncharacterized protein n=1 Tax=Pontibacter ummariensis TaxID=1610492 RepID=A0A239KD78_9BACT|nr:hypothetical protein CLV24_1274 [Pontibacter ummariensis]SNT16297.1 hypothetical protein SAMN06296052_1284 [Pontibacter ummariensis]
MQGIINKLPFFIIITYKNTGYKAVKGSYYTELVTTVNQNLKILEKVLQ